jgi:hypothetical protein
MNETWQTVSVGLAVGLGVTVEPPATVGVGVADTAGSGVDVGVPTQSRRKLGTHTVAVGVTVGLAALTRAIS